MWPFPCAEHVVHDDSYQLYKSIQESFPLHENLLCCLWNTILTELRLQGRSQPCSYTDRPWYRAVAIVADRRSIAAACKNVSRNFFYQVCALIVYRNACLVVLIHQNASCCSRSSIWQPSSLLTWWVGPYMDFCMQHTWQCLIVFTVKFGNPGAFGLISWVARAETNISRTSDHEKSDPQLPHVCPNSVFGWQNLMIGQNQALAGTSTEQYSIIAML